MQILQLSKRYTVARCYKLSFFGNQPQENLRMEKPDMANAYTYESEWPSKNGREECTPQPEQKEKGIVAILDDSSRADQVQI